MGDFKVGMLGKCMKCGKSIKLLTIQHKFCKKCGVIHQKEREKEYHDKYQKEHSRKRNTRCWICGDRITSYSVKNPTCEFCQTYTIEWNNPVMRKKYSPEAIRQIKNKLNEMVEEGSYKRFCNPNYTSILGGERL